MNKKFRLSLVLAILMSVLVIGIVIAGSSLDYGSVEDKPPVGEVNWTAWFNNAANTLVGGMPKEVMTEDGTNSGLGVDQGYQLLGSEPAWYLQATLLEFGKGDGEPIKMIFGGLGASSGKIWIYEFNWDGVTGFTDHDSLLGGPVPLSSQVEACPVITQMGFEGSTKNISFEGLASSTYHVYRSRNASGADNQASNGRYLYLKTVTTDVNGVASFSDVSDIASWYIVIRADTSTNELVGCHSEEAFPTSTRMITFEAEYDADQSAVVLSWEYDGVEDVQVYNLFRGLTDNSADRQLLAGDLPASATTYPDFDVDADQTYYYWIEVVGKDTNRSEYGPVSATVPAAVLNYYYYLPLMQH